MFEIPDEESAGDQRVLEILRPTGRDMPSLGIVRIGTARKCCTVANSLRFIAEQSEDGETGGCRTRSRATMYTRSPSRC